MTQKKQTTTKKTTTKTKATKTTAPLVCNCNAEKHALADATERITDMTIADDFRNSVLIVSLLINLFFLVAWMTIQVTTKYDYVVSAVIFGR